MSAITTPQMIREGVYRLPDAEVYAVESDSTSRIYRVTIWNRSAVCTCPSRKGCKHIRRVMKSQGTTF